MGHIHTVLYCEYCDKYSNWKTRNNQFRNQGANTHFRKTHRECTELCKHGKHYHLVKRWKENDKWRGKIVKILNEKKVKPKKKKR